jgi:hypothetical protein
VQTPDAPANAPAASAFPARKVSVPAFRAPLSKPETCAGQQGSVPGPRFSKLLERHTNSHGLHRTMVQDPGLYLLAQSAGP